MNQTGWRLRLIGPAVVLAVLLGTWSGHALEVLQQQLTVRATMQELHLPPGFAKYLFPTTYSISPFGGVHTYLTVAGIFLAALASLVSFSLWKRWVWLSRTLDNTRGLLLKVFRNQHVVIDVAQKAPSVPARLISLWLPMAAAQIGLYLVIENIEAAAMGHPLPGLAVITGMYWSASLIQVGLAFVLAAAVLTVARLLARKAVALIRARALVERIANWTWRDRTNADRPPVRPAVASIFEIIGSSVWQRPPPVCS